MDPAVLQTSRRKGTLIVPTSTIDIGNAEVSKLLFTYLSYFWSKCINVNSQMASTLECSKAGKKMNCCFVVTSTIAQQ